jgi:hypothetical protein
MELTLSGEKENNKNKEDTLITDYNAILRESTLQQYLALYLVFSSIQQ